MPESLVELVQSNPGLVEAAIKMEGAQEDPITVVVEVEEAIEVVEVVEEEEEGEDVGAGEQFSMLMRLRSRIAYRWRRDGFC